MAGSSVGLVSSVFLLDLDTHRQDRSHLFRNRRTDVPPGVWEVCENLSSHASLK